VGRGAGGNGGPYPGLAAGLRSPPAADGSTAAAAVTGGNGDNAGSGGAPTDGAPTDGAGNAGAAGIPGRPG